MDPQLAEALLYLLCKSIAELAMRPLTAARPWDDSAWTGAVFCAGPRTVYDMQTIVILELWASSKPDTEALVG